MKYRTILVSIVRGLCLFILMMLSTLLLFSQSNKVDSIFFCVRSIEKDTLLKQASKLQALYELKDKADHDKKTNDTGYVFLLVKIAVNEYSVNRNYNSAINYSLQALMLNSQLKHPVSNNVLINCCYNLATYYTLAVQDEKAIVYYDSVLALCKQHDPADYTIECRYRRAAFFVTLGDYEKELDESTIGYNAALKKKDTAHLILLLNTRIEAFTYMDRDDEALADLKTVLPLEQATNDVTGLATSYLAMADIFSKKGQTFEAEKYYLKTIQVRPIDTGFYERTASDYNKLAVFYANNLKNFSKAKENYLKTLFYANKCLLNIKPLYLLMAYVNLGELYEQQNKISESIACYKNAFEQIRFFSKDFLFANPSLASLSSFESIPNMFELLGNKADLLLTLYKKSKNPRYLDACIKTALLTDSIITLNRHQNITESSKLYWRDESRAFFNDAIEACYLANDNDNAFYFMEKSRAVLLNDKWNELSANIHLPAKESDKREFLQSEILQQKQKLSALQPSSSQYTDVHNNLLLTIDSLENFIKSLEKKYPIYYQGKYADNVPSLEQLQQYLIKNNESFIYYFMNDTALYALGIMKTETTLVKISKSEFDSHQLPDFIRLCSDKQAMMNHYSSFTALSQVIYNKLFKPLQIPKGNVAICTDNFFIPFEALCSDEKGKNFLLNDYNFSYVYSARSLLKSFTYSPPAGNFIGFAPGSFSRSLGVLDLAQSASALQNVAAFYSNHTLFTQQEASRSNFINQASHYSVVTIFSHAKADTTDTEPVLYMQDSVIHLSDLQRLNNPSTQFVLLSACQTNIGKNATGEGIYSLARGFASAGIPSVSATLWKADEETIYDISTRFNAYLAKGMNKSEALQRAKRDYLQHCDKEHQLPYYWANLVLIGSSQPLKLTSSNQGWIWVCGTLIFIAVFCLVVYFFYYKKKRRLQVNINQQRQPHKISL